MKLKTLTAALIVCFSSSVWAQNVTADELKLSKHLTQIRAPQGWAVSTGAGVVVGVVDSGINSANPDLSGQVLTVPKTNFIGGASTDTRDLNGHGTHVAGIIAAAANGSGVVGVAPAAKLVAVRVASANGRVSASALGQGIRRAAELAPIINVSIGGASCCLNDIKYAVTRGTLLVAAAGNNGSQAPVWPARYAKEQWANGQIIVVGAVDQSNRIASWSNRAGDTQNYFLVAPGQWILSTKDTSLVYMSGTSMAAPQVAGAAALVKSKWTFLRANQIAEILLRSATDLGAPGTDPVYGRGLLNIEQALKPIGGTYIFNANGQLMPAASAQIFPAAAYATATKNTKVQSIEVDEFGRDFAVDLSKFVKVVPDQTLSNILAQDFDQAKHTRASSNMEVSFGQGQLSTGILGGGIRFAQLGSNNKNVRLAASAMSNPAINLVPHNNHVGAAQDLGSGLQVKVAAFTTAGAGQLLNQAAGPRSRATTAALIQKSTHTTIGLTVSTLNESNRFLGGGASGFALSGAPNLRFVTAEIATEISNNTAAFMQYTRAASANGTNTSGFSATVSSAQAVKLGIVQTDIIKRDDQLTVTLEQPLKVFAGKLTATLPTSRDETGQVIFEKKTIDLATSGRETQIKFDYMMPVKKQTHARAFLQFNHNPAHDNTASTQAILGLQLFMTF